jgi:hypothetical protein
MTTLRPRASRYCRMPSQYVDLPEPGGPITTCPKTIKCCRSETRRRSRVNSLSLLHSHLRVPYGTL